MSRAGAGGASTEATPYRDRALAPVRYISGDERRGAEPGVGLCLSGGGYRAMLFHLGALWRLNELGELRGLARVSSVSGGSITAALLGAEWNELEFDPSSAVAENFESRVVAPIRRLASKTIDVRAVLGGVLLPGSVSRRIERTYDAALFDGRTLQAFPDDDEGPRFVINATNLQSGALWRFSKAYAADYAVGSIAKPEISLARAVAASSAFPPVLAPTRFRFDSDEVEAIDGAYLHEPRYTTRPVLADGGVYDNLGLETVWKRCQTVLISDAGGAMAADHGKIGSLPYRWRDWGTQTKRVLSVIDSQVRSLRKRQALAGFESDPSDRHHRAGAYWGIRSDPSNFSPPEPSDLDLPARATMALAKTPTRLRALDQGLQKRIINWGYAACDLAMRAHVTPAAPAPTAFPYPDEGVGPDPGSGLRWESNAINQSRDRE